MNRVLALFVLSLGLLFATPALAAFPAVGQEVDAGVGCASLSEAKDYAKAIAEGKGAEFAAKEGNSCGDATNRFRVKIEEYVAEVNDCRVARVSVIGSPIPAEGFKVICP